MRRATILTLAASLLSCVCSRKGGDGDGSGQRADTVARDLAATFTVDEARATADLDEMTKAPHPFGSARQKQIAEWLAARIAESGLKTNSEPFSATVPNPAALNPEAGPVAETLTREGVNMYGLESVRPDAPCVVAIGSHFDTKIVEGLDYVGANDSGSSSVVLLQVLAHLKAQAVKADTTCDIIGIWFDGEEAVLANWHDGERRHPAKIQDNTYGSRHAASRLTECVYEGAAAKCLPASLGGRPLVALILLDMIGSPGLQLTRESHSTRALMDLAALGADALGFGDRMGSTAHAIDDDHIPYLEAGVPAADLIDFNNLATWHREGDEAAAVSLESLKIAGRIALYTALHVARDPKVSRPWSDEPKD